MRYYYHGIMGNCGLVPNPSISTYIVMPRELVSCQAETAGKLVDSHLIEQTLRRFFCHRRLLLEGNS